MMSTVPNAALLSPHYLLIKSSPVLSTPTTTVPVGTWKIACAEHQLDLFSDRTFTHAFDTNQLRLWFSSVAYVLMQALRQHCLVKTELATAQLGTIRTKLLKLGAQVRRARSSGPDCYQ